MTLTELNYILTLARTRHFGAAAKLCHVSQPSLSLAIKKLENELGVAIFERDTDIKISTVGEKIIAQAQRVMEEVANIKTIARAEKSQINNPLKVGVIPTVGPYLLPHLIPKLKRIAPTMPLWIHEDFTANLRTKLKQGELDAIFISLPFSENGIVTQVLYNEPLMILMRKDHPLNQHKNISAAELATQNLLLLGENHCFRKQVLEVCPDCERGTNLQQTVEGSSLETLRHMVASGMGITVLPSSALQMQFYKSLLCAKPFKGKIPQRQIALAWRLSFPRPKAISALLAAMKSSDMHNVCLLSN